MANSLPVSAQALIGKSWADVESHYLELAERPLTAENVQAWLADWSRLSELLYEVYQRLYVATTVDTTDEAAEQAYNAFLDDVYPPSQAADQVLKQKLLDSGLQPEGFEQPLRNLRAEVEIFCEANLPLLSQELKLASEYARIAGVQTVEWDGQEVTLPALQPVYQEPDRERRERAWRMAGQRWLEDREPINDLWTRLLQVRLQLASNAGYPDYRAYRWKQLKRFDYNPEDCARFHAAIEEVIVPVAGRIYEKRRQRLGVERLRPWDLNVDPLGRPPLRPFESTEELENKTAAIFHRVNPQLGEHFEVMRQEGLLDLENRKGKAPGAYCTDFPAIRRPFIFANAVGMHDDVQTLLHEGGHAFHVFESAGLPYFQQLQVGMEFAEVASMAMEFLAAPYLTAEYGGFYDEGEAARARIEHIESSILFWPYMAVVDAFQHWVYEHPEQAADPANCDAHWAGLWRRFMGGVDWSGLESEMETGWHRKLHIFEVPFYYVEYGLAQLGAFQVWRNALGDQASAVAAYRRALSLGGTVSLPELFSAAGARFAFDPDTLRQAADLAERTLEKLEAAAD